MARRRRKQKSFPFWKLLGVLALITAVVWYFQKSPDPKNLSKDQPIKFDKTEKPESGKRVFSETEAAKEVVTESLPKTLETQASESQPATLPAPPAKSISRVLSKEGWPDDYIKIDYPGKVDGTPLQLVAYGLVPEGKEASKIRNPEVLKPMLAMAKKNGEAYEKIAEINLQKSTGDAKLKGIARIKENDFIDIDKDGVQEIIVHVDVKGQSGEKIGLLKWDGKEFSWMKKRVGNKEEVAFWKSGGSGTENRKIKMQKEKVIEQSTEFDLAHPNKGFENKKIEWKLDKGVWVKK